MRQFLHICVCLISALLHKSSCSPSKHNVHFVSKRLNGQYSTNFTESGELKSTALASNDQLATNGYKIYKEIEHQIHNSLSKDPTTKDEESPLSYTHDRIKRQALRNGRFGNRRFGKFRKGNGKRRRKSKCRKGRRKNGQKNRRKYGRKCRSRKKSRRRNSYGRTMMPAARSAFLYRPFSRTKPNSRFQRFSLSYHLFS